MNDKAEYSNRSHIKRPAPGGGPWDGAPSRGAEEPRLAEVMYEPESRDFSANGHTGAPFNPWPLVETVARRWFTLALAGCAMAVLAFVAGTMLWKTRYTAGAQLLRFDTPNNSELFKPRQLSEQTFASILRSPELLRDVSALVKPPLNPDQLAASLTVVPEKNSDVVTVSITAFNRQSAVEIANLFANEAVRFSRKLQVNEARASDTYYTNQLADLDGERDALVSHLQQSVRETVRSGIGPVQFGDRFMNALADKLQAAREDLVGLLANYTEIHPLVRAQHARIDELQKQLERMATNTTASAAPGSSVPGPLGHSSTNSLPVNERGSEFEVLRAQLQALEARRGQLITRQREAHLFEKDPPGYCQLFAPATERNAAVRDRRPKVLFLAVFGGMMGVAGAALLLLSIEFMDERLKTGTDVKRVTHLPLLATLGNLHRLDQTAQENWAFRTWTAMQHRLSISPNHGLVCGMISARPGEGRTTWISLLAQAASQCGFRVLTIGTLPNSEGNGEDPHNRCLDGDPNYPNGMALTTHVLSTPALVTEQLTGSNPQPFVHIPLPGWVWNLERRKEWQTALNQWSRIENIVILVELPPALSSEAVLLAENLPNLIWLTRNGKANAHESHTHLETLRNARCRLVGAVLNDETAPPLKTRFERWLGCAVILTGLCFCNARAAEGDSAVAIGADAPAEAPSTNLSFSVAAPAQRATWQQHFTLGPGDVVNIGLFGQPELSRADVFIGPDGRISYLQAQDIVAAGLTVDELRTKFDEELAKYYRAPRTIITPTGFHSKKYYVLGKVTNRGVFTLERPLTIVEAVAQAKGLETGLLPDNRSMMNLADLQRSFVMRQGKRLPVNLEKLFQEGDLSQNVALEPEDYLYFAAANLKQIFVLGEVNLPGPLAFTGNQTVVGAISARGGFTQRAYKGRVLVIRGSLNQPQTFVVDVWKTAEGRAIDFKLQPKDIVYVNYRPFIRAEELIDLGITAFIQSVIVEWTTLNIFPQRLR